MAGWHILDVSSPISLPFCQSLTLFSVLKTNKQKMTFLNAHHGQKHLLCCHLRRFTKALIDSQ